MKCNGCGDKLTNLEEKEIQAAKEMDPSTPQLCNECFLIADDENEIEEGFSDADPGL